MTALIGTTSPFYAFEQSDYFGRIIVQNIIANGFKPSDMRIIRPEVEEFEGIRCVADLASLDVSLICL